MRIWSPVTLDTPLLTFMSPLASSLLSELTFGEIVTHILD